VGTQEGTRIILIRHGETRWNAEGRYQGQADVPLNEKGVRQAELLAQGLRASGIAAIYSSDLSRASRTAEVIGQALGLKVQIDPGLREINQGEWEGLLLGEIRARYPEILEKRLVDPLSVAPPGGESVREVQERVLASIEAIAGRHPGETVGVVSHGLAIALVRVRYEGHPITLVWDLIPPNTDPVEIRV
jgi:broad specificity phosphatase PhoE